MAVIGNKHNLRHGMSHSPEYKAWEGMIYRCYCPKYAGFKRYGGRGITVHQAWRDDFRVFLAEVGPRPSPKHSLDRKDNERGYEPGNVRWATKAEQQRNRSNSVKLTANGKTLSAVEWARELGVSKGVIANRLKRGHPIEKVLSPQKFGGQGGGPKGPWKHKREHEA